MKLLFTTFLTTVLLFLSPNLSANSVMPLSDNAIAPDFTVTDLNGVSHTLYDYLDDGKMVILDFSATWCPPCWNYHQAHILKDIYTTYGPNGTDEIMVLFVEADVSTPVSALYGTGNTQGDWVTGTPYPIIDDGNGSLNNAYQISFFPTLYGVCSDRKIYQVGQTSISGWLNRLESCGLQGGVTTDDVTCFGDSDGSADLTASGGYGSVNYTWSTGANSEDISNLSSGNYAVTITDILNRQVVVENVFVNEPAPVLVNTTFNQSVSCNGGTDGVVSVVAAGGNSGFSYTWSNGASGTTISNISAGAYTVTATDSEGCVGSETIIVTQPVQVSASASVLPENCGNSDGFLFVSASGGTFPYQYDFGNGPGSTPILNGLTAGTYNVTVSDLLGCSYVDSYIVEEVPAPVASIATAPMLDCNASVVVLDGTGSSSGSDFSYTWTTSNGNIVSGASTLNPEVDGTGTYVLEVFNAVNGCLSTSSIEVFENTTLPTADAGNGGAIDCLNNVFTIVGTASQGASFSYLWTTTDGNIISDASALTIDVDAEGTYELEVLDNTNGCSVSSTALILGNFDLPAANIATAPELNCSATEVQLDGSGSETGVDIEHLWSSTDGNIVSGETGLTPVVDAAGTYTLSVTNTVTGCVTLVDILVEEDVDLPLADAGVGGELNCETDVITLVATSSDAATMVYEWTDAAGTVLSSDLELDVDQLGVYTFTATNLSNGCFNQSSTEVTEDFNAPFAEAGSAEAFICSTASMNLDGSASDQGASILFEWSTQDGQILNGSDQANPEIAAAGTYTLTIINTDNGCVSVDDVVVADNTDSPVIDAEYIGALNCESDAMSIDASQSTGGSNMTFEWTTSDGQILSGADASTVELGQSGSYTLMLTNQDNDCVSIESFIVEGALPVELEFVEAISPLCFDSEDGFASVNASGGDGNFEYLWPDGTTEPTNSNLSEGVYTVLVTDGNNCTAELDVEVLAPQELTLVGIAIDETSADANDGSAQVLVTGGTGDYTVLWSNGETGAEIDGLEPGEYIVMVTDENGCTSEISLDINAFGCSVSAEISATSISCFGMNDGTATVEFVGDEIQSVEWSNGATTASVNDLEPGLYSVVVVDVNNCPAEANIEILEPEAIDLSSSTEDILCNGDTNGMLSVTAAGGTGSLNPQWSTGSTDWAISDLSAGAYSLTVIDENGCELLESFELTEPAVMEGTAQVDDVLCFDMNNGAIDLQMAGGTGAYSYIWSNDEVSSYITDLGAGTYSVEVLDENACLFEEEFIISQPSALELDLIEIIDSESDAPTGAVTVSTFGGTEPYNYEWYFEGDVISTEQNLQGVNAGSYSLVLTDDNACIEEFGPFVVDMNVSSNDLEFDFDINVFPNPSSGLFFVEVSDLNSQEEISLEVVDLTGKVISSSRLSGSSNFVEKINLDKNASGVYLLKIVMSDQVQLIRLINE
jgi:thiol-disulfide isomerase/thioredoxin